jgi:hypothetical protein
MKRVRMAAGTLLIAIMIAVAGSAFAGSGLPNPPPGGLAPKAGHGAGVQGQHHPTMRNAIEQLGRVKQMLTKDTEPETAGHRAQAILLIDQAIEQLKEGVAQAKH